jgi:hypothetical protein
MISRGGRRRSDGVGRGTKKTLVLLLASCSCIGVTPALAAATAKQHPWVVSGIAGYAPTGYRGDEDGSLFPIVSVGRVIDQRWQLRVAMGHLQYRYQSLYGSSLLRERATFITLAAGARFCPMGVLPARPAPFMEAAPLLSVSRWKTDGSQSHSSLKCDGSICQAAA